MRNRLVLGEWNAVCDVCGCKYKGTKLRLRWDGLRVCADDYNLRHPQELLRVPLERSGVPWASLEPTDVFITGYDSLYTESNILIQTEAGVGLEADT